MKKILLYFLLVISTIASIMVKWDVLITIHVLIWIGIIIYKVKQELNNRFKDWEMEKYNYNAISKKEQKEHYNEYKNERKSKKHSK